MARRAESLEIRFERMVDRSGEHHMWLGRINSSRGTGVIKVNKVDITAHRVAWELTNGPLPPKACVAACTANSACVRVGPSAPLRPPQETTHLKRGPARGRARCASSGLGLGSYGCPSVAGRTAGRGRSTAGSPLRARLRPPHDWSPSSMRRAATIARFASRARHHGG